MSLDAADAYCRQLVRHYENFTAASRLSPRSLRQDLTLVYAFCRYTDDLGDESGDRAVATRRLRRWRDETRESFEHDERTHPVLVALARQAFAATGWMRNRLSISSTRTCRISVSTSTRTGPRCLGIAGVPPHPSVAWSCASSASTTRLRSHSATTSASDCSSPTSRRMSWRTARLGRTYLHAAATFAITASMEPRGSTCNRARNLPPLRPASSRSLAPARLRIPAGALPARRRGDPRRRGCLRLQDLDTASVVDRAARVKIMAAALRAGRPAPKSRPRLPRVTTTTGDERA